MDPDAAVRAILLTDDTPCDVREHGEALREWIVSGGFPPDGYTQATAYEVAAAAERCRSTRDITRLREKWGP